jgi:hypothetical protein
MHAIDVHRHATGARAEAEGLVFDADSPYLDRSRVRVALTIRQGGVIQYRNTVNLTSERSRVKLLAALAEKALSVDEAVLIALDEACRKPPPRLEKNVCDTPSDISDKPPVTLDGLREIFRRWLLIADPALLPVLTGAILAHRLESESVWLLLVAPPGATKSELLRALYGYPGIYPLSELTARTFASGLDVPEGDPSLLARLHSEILVLKDFTTVLEMHREERQAILAQLREIYDGRFDKTWGTGRELHWEGRLGFLAGVTPVIDQHQAAMSILGERFITLRTITPDRRQLARAALEAAGREREMRRDLATSLHGFLAQRGTIPPTVSAAVRSTLATVADFVTRARSGVLRDGYKRHLEYAPEPEAPTRFAKVLLALASGIALAYDEPEVTPRALQWVLRVALDCLPVVRHRVIAALVCGAISDTGDALSTTEVAGATQFATVTIRRALEDLQALEVVTCHKATTGKADDWELETPWAAIFRELHAAASTAPEPIPDWLGPTLSEMSDPPSHTNNGAQLLTPEELRQGMELLGRASDATR